MQKTNQTIRFIIAFLTYCDYDRAKIPVDRDRIVNCTIFCSSDLDSK